MQPVLMRCAAPSGLWTIFLFHPPLAYARGYYLPPLRGLIKLMSFVDLMHAIDTQLTHVWMVRTFLKHSEEAKEDDEVAEVHRELYDYMLALGAPLKEGNAEEYLRVARKKFGKLKRAAELFGTIQPEVSGHTNFVMAVGSLKEAVGEIGRLLAMETEGRSEGETEGSGG